MELRRALLLFAIVLGVAAIVSALAGPSSRDETRTTAASPAPERRGAPARPPTTVRLDGRGAAGRRPLEAGRATTIVVEVDEPGQVEVTGLGLTEAAEPRDPAVFETLPRAGARYRVRFTPAGGARARDLGELVTRAAK